MVSTSRDEMLTAADYRTFWTVDRMIVGFYGATVALVLVCRAAIPHAGWVAAGHAAAAGGYILLKRLAARHARLRLPYLLSPMALVVGAFSALGAIIPHLSPETRDAALARIDIDWFGSDPTRWFDGMPTWLGSILQYAYTSYYFLFIAVAAVALRRRRQRTYLVGAAVVTGCLFTTYIGYYLVPAYGPRTYYAYDTALSLGPVATAIHDTLNALEKIKLNAFPSGHTALSVVCVLILFRLRSPLAGWSVLPVCGLIVSTVALRYHYLVDVVAGLLIVPLWYPFGWNLVARLDARRSRSAS